MTKSKFYSREFLSFLFERVKLFDKKIHIFSFYLDRNDDSFFIAFKLYQGNRFKWKKFIKKFNEIFEFDRVDLKNIEITSDDHNPNNFYTLIEFKIHPSKFKFHIDKDGHKCDLP